MAIFESRLLLDDKAVTMPDGKVMREITCPYCKTTNTAPASTPDIQIVIYDHQCSASEGKVFFFNGYAVRGVGEYNYSESSQIGKQK